jgi:RNA polymerase sigma factor (sigma-70 family)
MANADPTTLAAHLRRMAVAEGGLPDAELVRRYTDRRDEAAFEVLVWRHGPMVWATCRRVLRHQQDAEDAFQAVFLALARCARSVGTRGTVAGWLHRVAVNAALKLKASRERERPEPIGTPVAHAPGSPDDAECIGVVDEELNRLPDHYRAAFVLCCLEGKTNAEAARELGCPVGTVDSRLHAARSRLQKNLTRRGIGPGVLAGLAVAAVPETLTAAAIGFGMGAAAPPAVARLANTLGGAMTRRTMTVAVASVLTVIVAGAAVWAFAAPPADPAPTPPPQPAAVPIPEPAVADRGPALLFTEMVLKPGENSSHTLRLVRAEFQDGKLASREEVYVGEASEFGYLAKYRVIDNRYVVLESSTVIDTVEKKVLHRFDGRVLRVEGKRVYFYTTRDGDDAGVFCFDLATGKRERVANLGEGRWGLRGASSPDGTKAIVQELVTMTGSSSGTSDGKGGSTTGSSGVTKTGDEFWFSLVLQTVRPGEKGGTRRTSLGAFASSCGATGGGMMPDAPPGVWLDNDHFLTQKTLGKLVVINTTDNTITNLIDLPATFKKGGWDLGPGQMGFTKLGHQQPRFWKTPDGRIAYEVDELFLIRIEKKPPKADGLLVMEAEEVTWVKSGWRPLGHGFDVQADPDRAHKGKMYFEPIVADVRHDGKVIGESPRAWMSVPEKPQVVTADGHLAVVDYVERPGKVPLLAVRVWTAATGKWEILDGWADSVIGWVK